MTLLEIKPDITWIVSSDPSASIAHWLDDEAMDRLLTEVLAQAVKEAMGKGLHGSDYGHRCTIQTRAREWLVSSDSEMLCDDIKYNFEALCDWVSAGCPEREARLFSRNTSCCDYELRNTITVRPEWIDETLRYEPIFWKVDDEVLKMIEETTQADPRA